MCRLWAWTVAALSFVALAPATLSGEPVTVRHTEGVARGFLALRTLDGKIIANGDLIQIGRAHV